MPNTKREWNDIAYFVIAVVLLYMTAAVLQYWINVDRREQIQELRSRVEKLEAGRDSPAAPAE